MQLEYNQLSWVFYCTEMWLSLCHFAFKMPSYCNFVTLCRGIYEFLLEICEVLLELWMQVKVNYFCRWKKIGKTGNRFVIFTDLSWLIVLSPQTDWTQWPTLPHSIINWWQTDVKPGFNLWRSHFKGNRCDNGCKNVGFAAVSMTVTLDLTEVVT